MFKRPFTQNYQTTVRGGSKNAGVLDQLGKFEETDSTIEKDVCLKQTNQATKTNKGRAQKARPVARSYTENRKANPFTKIGQLQLYKEFPQ